VYPRVVVCPLDDGQHSILTAVSATSACKGRRTATHGLLLLLWGTTPTASSGVAKATSSWHALRAQITAGNGVSNQQGQASQDHVLAPAKPCAQVLV
jgi:hypothetical protein